LVIEYVVAFALVGMFTIVWAAWWVVAEIKKIELDIDFNEEELDLDCFGGLHNLR